MKSFINTYSLFFILILFSGSVSYAKAGDGSTSLGKDSGIELIIHVENPDQITFGRESILDNCIFKLAGVISQEQKLYYKQSIALILNSKRTLERLTSLLKI
jgi:hypothetical protein